MKAVLQRVREASVRVVAPAGAFSEAFSEAPGAAGGAGVLAGAPADREVASIGPGLLVLVAFAGDETAADLDWVAERILALRLFGPSGEFDTSVVESGGEVLVVSQFTLLAGLRKGRRPDFAKAASAAVARPLYERFVERLLWHFPRVRQGVFGAEMRVALVNDGPATFLLEREPPSLSASPVS